MKSCIYRLLAGVLLILSETASAAVYYVGGAGASNANDGSQISPWATINYAATKGNPGDTVLVAPGIYNESVTINVSGTAGAPITFRAEPARQALLQQFTVQGDYITIDGFEITNTKTGANGFGIKCGQSNYNSARTGCQIINNYIHDLEDTGIYSGVNGMVRGNLMRNVDRGIFLNSGSTAMGNEVDTLIPLDGKTQYIYFVGDNMKILGNYLHGTPMDVCKANGIDWFTTFDGPYWGPSHNILIEDNICYNAAHGCEPSGGSNKDSGPITFRNNLFHSTVYVGIYCQNFRGITIENNTFVNCGVYPIWFQSLREVEDTVVLNNLITTWNHDPNPYGGALPDAGIRINSWLLPTAATGTVVNFNMMWEYPNRNYGTNDFTAEPRFVDPDNGDFRLLPGSPGIDAGTVTGATADQNGTVRPYGTAFDIGAYEFHP